MVGTTDCTRKSARVKVNGTEVPTVDTSQHEDPAISTQVRTDGPASVTRISDIFIPAYWRGENVFNSLPLDASSEITVPVTVQTRPPQGSTYERNWRTVHYGWLRKIGSGGEGRLLRLKVADYANIANNTPVTKTWTDSSYRTILDWTVKRLNEKDGFPTVQLGSTPVTEPDEPTSDPVSPLSPMAIRDFIATSIFGEIPTASFNATEKDTVADVLNWLAEQTGLDWWFEPTSSGLVLMFTDLSNTTRSWDARNVGGDLYVRDNRALYSIDPINTLSVIGGQINGVVKEGGEGTSVSNLYVTATATNEKLLANAGGQINEKVIRGSYSDLDAAKNVAKKKLQEEIRSGGEGEMVVDGHPSIFLNNTITSKPLCGEYVSGDVPEVTYSVKSVRHEAPATGRYNTVTSVGMYVDEDNITVSGGYGDNEGDVLYQPDEVAVPASEVDL